MHSAPDLLVFSDLDGTLLDHATYSFAAARPALDRLTAMDAGLVLASSKTAAELDPLRRQIGCTDWPAIVENGAGILWPGETADATDAAYRDLRAALADLPDGFRGFGDMTDAEVAQITGLPLTDATRARARRHSEPGLWQGNDADLQKFLDAAKTRGVHARRGGRFLTLSFGRTKADAMAEVIARLKPKRTIALGDAPNDVEMIEAADHGVIVANPASTPLPPLPTEARGGIFRTTQPGPAGWAEAILALTDEHDQNKATDG